VRHVYRSRVSWTGSTGVGYDSYDRDHHAEVITDAGVVVPTVDGPGLRLSGDAAFGGNGALINTEQLLVVAASACQMLSFLAVAARARIDVVEYLDEAVGEMPADWIATITLRPVITVRGDVSDERLQHWVEVGHRECYVANSLRSQITVEARFRRRIPGVTSRSGSAAGACRATARPAQ
jgi:organic hydroperoxide reductase OsmC/OhrA